MIVLRLLAVLAATSVASSGSLRVVAGQDSSEAVHRGGSATAFSFRLPDNATCPGDSADDNYRVQSFMVPAGTDPGTIRYKSQGPDVPGGWALYKTTTNAYIQEQTADAKNPGDPGPILAPPSLSFAVFTGGELTPGRYHVGVACSLFNETKKYWSTDIVLREDATDAPARLRWRLASAQADDTETDTETDRSKIVIAAAVLAAVLGGAIYLRRDKSGAVS